MGNKINTKETLADADSEETSACVNNRIVRRAEAAELLEDLADKDIFPEGVSQKLLEIANCIKAELLGRHEWGMSSKINDLLCCENRSFSEIEQHLLDELDSFVRVIPSHSEEDEIFDYLKEEYSYAGMEMTDEEIRNIMFNKRLRK